MYKHLSKKEKQKKLAQARKLAVVWSAREQWRKTLKTTESLEKSSTLKTSSIPTQETDTFYPAIFELYLNYNPPLSEPTDITVAALQTTINDLLVQRHQLDISIQVLKGRLEHIISSTSKQSDNNNQWSRHRHREGNYLLLLWKFPYTRKDTRG